MPIFFYFGGSVTIICFLYFFNQTMSNFYSDWQKAVQRRFIMEISRPLNLVNNILTTQGFIYPFKGIAFFFCYYKQLLPIYLSVVIPYSILHFYICVVLFIVILPINLFICSMTLGPLGVQMSILTTFQQCNCLNNYIFKEFLIKGKLNKVFDTTLCLTNLDSIVIPGRVKRVVPQTLGAKLMEINPINFSLFLLNLMYAIVLSFIPVVSTVSIYFNQSISIASSSQDRFWKLTRKTDRQIKYDIKDNEGEFLTFGMVCQVLENLPVLAIFFCFTNHVGAALLAGDRYKRNTIEMEGMEDECE